LPEIRKFSRKIGKNKKDRLEIDFRFKIKKSPI
jgi:hypothetical protein